MEKFRDRFAKEWSLDLTLGIVMEIEAYDFQGLLPKLQLQPPQDDLFTKQITNPKIVFGIVWIALQEQIRCFNDQLRSLPQEKQADPQYAPIHNEMDFARRCSGQVVSDMKLALWRELPNFFPESATSLRNLMARFSRVEEIARERLEPALQKNLDKYLSDEEIEKMINQQIQEMEQRLSNNQPILSTVDT